MNQRPLQAVRALPRTVVVLGLVSLFNDMASDMVVPLIPIWLAALGQGPVALGLVEGVADAVASALKLWAGWRSDTRSRRQGLAFAGYGISNLVRPLIGLARSWFLVLVLRAVDRLGKGIRTAPRDALLRDAAPTGMGGVVFGFHRAMDNLGAVGGALIAAWILSTHPVGLRAVLFGSAVPGLIAVLLMAWVARTAPPVRPVPRAPVSLSWGALPPRLRRYLGVLGLFAFARASEAFLILRAHEQGFPVVQVLLLWAAFNAAKAAAAQLGGHSADRWGHYGVLQLSWVTHALAFIGIALAAPRWLPVAVVLYGLFAGFGEGAERALVGDLASASERGTGFGWYYLITGAVAIPGGAAFGLLWHFFGPPLAFVFSAVLMALAALALRTLRRHG